ncbi:hypothetical protein [Mucilaginibacter gotjawali]|uniref:Uncharacterized protein n=2 Tax=Mucilaginibacter gotjawali TaxID=1550579 RepID=A0A110B322_9SPHI|nr:hypothetical protein [Mucilaginibacter gotjawali]MBB3055921.1 hypothetical protein [Mucilaginibacter gotjawali]BAU54745.1 hypothetical protein MgSA37_02923 [Mucilaginibacter gotjawali]
MEFKASILYFILHRLLWPAILMIPLYFNAVLSHQDYYFLIVLFAILTLLVCSMNYRIFLSVFINKPILIVNDEYVYDFVSDIKFYWKDIEGIREEKGYLRITLFDPIKYVDHAVSKRDNFFSKLLRKPYDKNNIFKINANFIKANLNNLLEVMDDFSIDAEDSENTLSLKR